mmetsp:Transcript_45421/g.106137  ORF Transcript_45421/g.106137 Transcript_45421/m.106137 type:complete len:638 (+) Transcript_45421:58-1971(+)
MAPAASQLVWIWDPVEAHDKSNFQHPADYVNKEAFKDEAAIQRFYVEKICGPRLSKLSKVTLLDQKGIVAMVSREDGSTHEVPKSRILPYYEGLLVLQEVEAKADSNVSWFDDGYRTLLHQERRKHKMLLGALYVERKLLNIAITGKGAKDADGKDRPYRRERLKPDDSMFSGAEEENVKDTWGFADVVGYMPPWEAFCDERCGIYQEFYQVRWDHPYTEVDYSRVENGGGIGTTWEPDEMLPPTMDVLRVREKNKWLKKKREQEQKEKETAEQTVKAGGGKRPLNESSPKLPEGGSPAEAEPQRPPPKKGRYRRNGAPLVQDMFRFNIGHDFEPPKLNSDVRKGWPKRAKDYPPGYGCADPPGLCFATCDCMDDQRSQKAWEMQKGWLEDINRTTDAIGTLDMLSAQTAFVRRRGQVSKICFFETTHVRPHEQTHLKAALHLATELEISIKSVLKDIPISCISADSEPVRIPFNALLKPGEDYAPVKFRLSQSTSARNWLSVGAEDGRLSVIGAGPASRPAPFRVELVHPEGMSGYVDCLVTDAKHKPWAAGSVAVAQRFSDAANCPLARKARSVLQEHFSKLYNFDTKSAKDIPLGRWLACADTIVRMLRTTALCNVVRQEAPTSRAPPRSSRAR